jgi:HEAT repeat protein
MVESGDFFLAFAALDALKTLGSPDVASRLVPLLADESLRTAAIGALAHLGDHSIVEPLVSMLDRPRLVQVVAEALTTLYDRYETQFEEGRYVIDLVRRHVTEDAARNLLDALNTTSGDVLHRVVRVLGWIGGERVISRLTLLLGSPALRSEVIEAFVRHGSEVTPLLNQQLVAEDLETRRASVVALGESARRSRFMR